MYTNIVKGEEHKFVYKGQLPIYLWITGNRMIDRPAIMSIMVAGSSNNYIKRWEDHVRKWNRVCFHIKNSLLNENILLEGLVKMNGPYRLNKQELKISFELYKRIKYLIDINYSFVACVSNYNELYTAIAYAPLYEALQIESQQHAELSKRFWKTDITKSHYVYAHSGS